MYIYPYLSSQIYQVSCYLKSLFTPELMEEEHRIWTKAMEDKVPTFYEGTTDPGRTRDGATKFYTDRAAVSHAVVGRWGAHVWHVGCASHIQRSSTRESDVSMFRCFVENHIWQVGMNITRGSHDWYPLIMTKSLLVKMAI